MSAQNKAIVRRYLEEIWNKGNLALVNELFTADCVDHDPSNPPGFPPPGPEGIKQLVTFYRSAFPDVYFTIQEEIAEGDKVATRWTARGTHKGQLMNIATTGKTVTSSGISISRIAGGKIAEVWVARDALGLMQQLGALPQLK